MTGRHNPLFGIDRARDEIAKWRGDEIKPRAQALLCEFAIILGNYDDDGEQAFRDRRAELKGTAHG